LDLAAMKPALKSLAQVRDAVPTVVLAKIATEHPEFGIDRSVAEEAVRAGTVVENTIELISQASTILESSFDS
jgi:hypothetical protein